VIFCNYRPGTETRRRPPNRSGPLVCAHLPLQRTVLLRELALRSARMSRTVVVGDCDYTYSSLA